ncbi:MAG: Xaa-Pro aminopeptidase [Bacilli bacterium]|nr:Xaa-Pro aminopeptidase [Bacilli bacterium]
MNTEVRRQALLKKIPDKSIVIFHAGKLVQQGEDGNYPFYVDRCFFYFTNISQENSLLILVKNNGIHEYLYINAFDEKKEKWFGHNLTIDEAKALSNINEIKTLDYFNNDLKTLLQSVEHVYLNFKSDNSFFDEFKVHFPKLIINNIYQETVNLRLIKNDDEVNAIKQAIAITHLGFKKIAKELKTAKYEYEVYNAFNHEILNHGTHEIGFPSIICSGIHACCLHYPTPYDKLPSNGLILCDVGAAYNHYCADVTRTFPVNGKFTDLQKTIYQIVLSTNKKIIEMVRPNVTITELQNLTKDLLAEGCLKANLIKNKDEITNYYMHGVAHHLGLDVHDVGGRDSKLEPGMVITIEPGLYFPDQAIGIRIEDDVLVTKDGYELLSKDIVKEINDIEKLF